MIRGSSKEPTEDEAAGKADAGPNPHRRASLDAKIRSHASSAAPS